MEKSTKLHLVVLRTTSPYHNIYLFCNKCQNLNWILFILQQTSFRVKPL